METFLLSEQRSRAKMNADSLAEGDRGMATARKDAFGSDQQVSRIVRVRAGDCVRLMMNKSVKPLFTAPHNAVVISGANPTVNLVVEDARKKRCTRIRGFSI